MFSEKDLTQLTEHQLSEEKILEQIAWFEKGFPKLQIIKPATIGDGIMKTKEGKDYINAYSSAKGSVGKFVPASGAATRMFKNLFAFLDAAKGHSAEEVRQLVSSDSFMNTFFGDIKSFAFHSALEACMQETHDTTIEEAISQGHHAQIVECVLSEEGLGYGSKPKGLILFHTYPEEALAAAEEQIMETLEYCHKSGESELHFTVSPQHLSGFKEKVSRRIQTLGASIKVTYSTQLPSTDTLAVSEDNQPFRNADGTLLLRPAGHGALLENLNTQQSDVVFIKNIDNVLPHTRLETMAHYKKLLAGVLVNYQEKCFELLQKADKGEDISVSGKALLSEMGVKGSISDDQVVGLLNRPIRACGMVKNEGEPGGGPFWVRYGSLETLQIVEEAQVDQTDEQQKELFRTGTHFNPVDLVCGLKNYKGEKFDLLKYRDPEAGFISEKSAGGKKLKAMELPGLWNGSMAHWNTIFVEVPLETFNPVKTVNDLLREAHQ